MLARLLLMLSLSAVSQAGHAHGLTPLLLKVEQLDANTLRLSLKSSVTIERTVEPLLPSGCTLSEPATRYRDGGAGWEVWNLHCPTLPESISLPGLGDFQAVAEAYGLDGDRQVALLSEQRPVFRIHQQSSYSTVVAKSLPVGVLHLLGGWDHVLFVVGLTLWLRRSGALIIAVTSFTLGHSVTLFLASAGLLKLPQAWAELGIAASLLVMAMKLTGSPTSAPSRVQIIGLPCGFGLLHGLGFAGALNAQGLSGTQLLATALGFNIGIELGQLFCIAAILLVLHVLRAREAMLRAAAVYSVGTLAVFWMCERTIVVLSSTT